VGVDVVDLARLNAGRLIAACMQRNAPSPSAVGAVMWKASPDMP
jgi:hypothetical protein